MKRPNDEAVRAAARRALPIYKREGWAWPMGLPTEDDIAATINMLLDTVEKHGKDQQPGEVNFSSTGRLIVSRYVWEDDEPEYGIAFNLCTADELYPEVAE